MNKRKRSAFYSLGHVILDWDVCMFCGATIYEKRLKQCPAVEKETKKEELKVG